MTACRARLRGFSLVELMTAVTIIGVLSALGVAFVGKHLRASHTAEALSMMQSIRAAQESYRAENRRYLDVSSSYTDYYPAKPDGKARVFYTADTAGSGQNWKILRPVVAGPVRFGYALRAGDSGSTPPALTAIVNPPAFGAATSPYYIIQAAGDMDGNGKYSYVVATSFTKEVYVQDDGE